MEGIAFIYITLMILIACYIFSPILVAIALFLLEVAIFVLSILLVIKVICFLAEKFKKYIIRVETENERR